MMCGVGAEYFFLKGCSQLEWRLVFLSRTSWVFMPSCKTVVSDSNSGDAPRKNDVLRLQMQTTDWVYFGQWKRYNNMKERKGNHDLIILCRLVLLIYHMWLSHTKNCQFNLSLENSEEIGSEVRILTSNTEMAGGVITMKYFYSWRNHLIKKCW